MLISLKLSPSLRSRFGYIRGQAQILDDLQTLAEINEPKA